MLKHSKQILILPLLIIFTTACGRLDFGLGPLLYDVSVSPDSISPNADGDTDVTDINYSLRRSATVSIYFENDAGERSYFREKQQRAPGNYNVLWGGVVDSAAPAEFDAASYGTLQTLSNVLSNGTYKWTIEAIEEDGSTVESNGQITLQNVDNELPQLHNFAVVPETFRPNQDGLRDDWVSISYYLTKDVDKLLIYLVDPNEPDVRFYLGDEPGVAKPNERGAHNHRYEGGIDLKTVPPPDGEYAIVADARDLSGNRVRIAQKLTIEDGGKPRADVLMSEIDWYAQWGDEGSDDIHPEMNRIVGVPLGKRLCFRAVIVNEGTVPIRTSGPWPGQEYRFGENVNTLAEREEIKSGDQSWFQQPGVWRFGINFDTTGFDFPYRWAVGRQDDLERRVIDGDEQWYLLPEQRSEVHGCIQIDEEPPIGTNVWWGGLLHQQVGVPNNNIDRITVQVGVP